MDARCGMTPPEKLGSYSITVTEEGAKFEEGENQIQVLKLPPDPYNVSLNVAEGYKPLTEEELNSDPVTVEPGLKQVLEWVAGNKQVLQQHRTPGCESEFGVDFLTIRGLLSLVMSTPFEEHEGWCIGVTKFRGTYFMYHLEFPEIEGITCEYVLRPEFANIIVYSGTRFEKYITEPVHRPEKEDETQGVYYVVVKTHLGRHSLAYGCEMDCVSDRSRAKDPELKDLIEIKSTQTVTNRFKEQKLFKKMMKWWFQCYLTGIETIVCGYRDHDNYVRKIDKIIVKELPKLGRGIWSPKVCLNFLNRFLDFVKQVATDDDPDVMYEFAWVPGMHAVKARKTTVTPKRFVINRWFVDDVLSS